MLIFRDADTPSTAILVKDWLLGNSGEAILIEDSYRAARTILGGTKGPQFIEPPAKPNRRLPDTRDFKLSGDTDLLFDGERLRSS